MFSALSNSELLIMQYLWQQNVPQTFSQIKEHFAETGWKNPITVRQKHITRY